VVHRGFSAYSSLQPLGPPHAPTHLGVLFECGESQPYERIDLAILDPSSFGGDHKLTDDCDASPAPCDETFGAWG